MGLVLKTKGYLFLTSILCMVAFYLLSCKRYKKNYSIFRGTWGLHLNIELLIDSIEEKEPHDSNGLWPLGLQPLH